MCNLETTKQFEIRFEDFRKFSCEKFDFHNFLRKIRIRIIRISRGTFACRIKVQLYVLNLKVITTFSNRKPKLCFETNFN